MSKAESAGGAATDYGNSGDEAARVGRGRGERKSLGERIKEAEDNLKRLVEQQRKEARAEREKFYRELLEHLKTEKAEEFPMELWRAATPAIRSTLAKLAKA